MKINDVNMLVAKIDVKENKEGNKYLMIGLLDMNSGDNFDILSKDLDLLGKLKPMTKIKCNLNLISNKYGLKLELSKIVESLGSI